MKIVFIFFTFAFLLLNFDFAQAQSPQGTSYQAVIRNSTGALVTNRTVSLRFSIHDSAANGPIVYQETQSPVTTAQGLVNCNVGMGTAVSSAFSNINWGNKSKFLQVELDANGGTSYTDMGTTQLMSVPYALYATKSQKADTALFATNTMPNGTAVGQMMYWNGNSWVNVQPGSNGQTLTFCYGNPQWGPCVILPSVTIGTQVWSTKNLDVVTYRNGDPIPEVTDPTQWQNLTTGAWCWYNNDSATYAATYGRLYNWYAVNDPRGLAPQGWHVPTDAEWNRLTKFIDPTADTTRCCSFNDTAASAMKSTTGWAYNGTNRSGFTAFPAGYRGSNATFFDIGNDGGWWSVSEFNTTIALGRNIYFNVLYLNRFILNKKFGFSVRVVRD